MNRWVHQKQTGFTIVELLIVVVVIAILAAISIVAYSGIQNRAYNSAVSSDITTVIKQLELTKVDTGRYPRSAAEFPVGFKFSKQAYDTTQNNIYYCYDITNDRYALGLRLKAGNGHIITTGVSSARSSVYAADTCATISKTWVNDVTTFVMQGFYAPPTSAWNTTWNWTN